MLAIGFGLFISVMIVLIRIGSRPSLDDGRKLKARPVEVSREYASDGSYYPVSLPHQRYQEVIVLPPPKTPYRG